MPLFVLLAAMAVSYALIWLLKPLLQRYALARPNARSSHRVPTPQGGGIAIVAATLLVGGMALAASGPFEVPRIAALFGATLVLALVGAVDDIRPLPAGPRLFIQLAAVAAVVFASDLRILPDAVPLAAERILLVLAGTWFVNLVNFMDGLDWITTAEMLPITGFFAALGELNMVPEPAGLVAAALCGALLGFAPFNKPVAKLFMGDVGSLPIGLLVGWLLLQLAGTGALAAALLLPLYHLVDATLTLLRRLARGERVWEAHRSHFYQQATTNGFSALAVSAHVFGLNLLLAALAALTLAMPDPAVQIGALVVGLALVGVMLRRFSRPRSVEALTETSR
ncbi:MAG TPA: glycosyltransferase family 4 protein [Microvirga sp.]|jgi:UDP-N-acetylmuramyl pentapeptide phosphotransferase/UDP-N-acetylglucosamine-1-phosphate transferase